MYSKENYRLLIAHLKEAGYQFYDFANDSPPETKSVFLRHDVEWFPASALPLAQENHKLSISGTFFFNISSPQYNLLAHPTEIALIQDLGQKIGFMYDPMDALSVGKNPFEEVLKSFADFRQIIPGADAIFVWGNGSTSELFMEMSKNHPIAGIKNVDFLPGISSLADIETDFAINELISFIDQQHLKIVLSLHPDFWIVGGQSTDELAQNLRGSAFKDFMSDFWVDE